MMRQQKGFVTIISVIIISAVLLSLVSTLSFSAFSVSAQSLQQSAHFQVRQANLACISIVRLRLLSLANYSGSESIAVLGGKCEVGNIEVDQALTYVWTSQIFVEQTSNTMAVSFIVGPEHRIKIVELAVAP